MSTTLLNEHDANQGAQSKGEFLGMTGNSAWYLLGSAGATVMMVIVLWGVLGVSLLLCIVLGLVLCLLSVTYVFALKNNRPAHYDTDFFESVLVEAGVIELAFGPRSRRASNPFARGAAGDVTPAASRGRASVPSAPGSHSPLSATTGSKVPAAVKSPDRTSKSSSRDQEPTVTLAAFEKVKAELMEAEDRLEEALHEREED